MPKSLLTWSGGFFFARTVIRSTTEHEKGHRHGVSQLSPERLDRYLALRDLTDAEGGRHAINILLHKLAEALAGWTRLPAEIVRRSPVVPVADNYDRLFYDADAVARSTRYSHYVDDRHILRTHTTASIPALLAETARAESDRLLVCPGLVYRRDVVDRLHVGEPHQVDLWIIRRARLRRADLVAMVGVVLDAILPGCTYRCNETHHPYTVNGLEVEVLLRDRWVEVLECGEAHPWLLNDSDLPSQRWSGLAMGIGLDRLAMLLKQMDDIRLLRSADPRISAQMLTLEPFRPVSDQPAIRRDLSICLGDPDMELLGDRIRDALGDRAEWVEDIALLQVSDFDATPAKARERLGMQPGQHNLLIRMTLRSLDGSIPREEANSVYDLAYAALHEGTAGYVRLPP